MKSRIDELKTKLALTEKDFCREYVIQHRNAVEDTFAVAKKGYQNLEKQYNELMKMYDELLEMIDNAEPD